MEETTIPALPDELLTLIIHFTAPRTDHWTSRYDVLVSLCQVNRRFLSIAQPFLYADIFTHTQKMAARLAESSALERLNVRRLHLGDLHFRVEGETARRVLSTVRGVKELQMSGYPEEEVFQRDWLCFPGLGEMTKLVLAGIYFHTNFSSQNGLPCPLTHLTLSPSSLSTPNSNNPFSFFAMPTLTHLTLWTFPDPDDVDEVADLKVLFSVVAPSLKSLEMNRHLPDWLLPSLSRFHRLTSLSLPCTGDELSLISSTLSSQARLENLQLNIWSMPNHRPALLASFIPALLSALSLPSFISLKRLRLEDARRRHFSEDRVGKLVLNRLEELKIEVEWGRSDEQTPTYRPLDLSLYTDGVHDDEGSWSPTTPDFSETGGD